jgi:putative ABC transport system substrate-binding protein
MLGAGCSSTILLSALARRRRQAAAPAEAQTIKTEYLYADGRVDRLAELAKTLVAHRPDIIVTAGTPGCLAAKEATTTIPVVFAASSDPLSTGVVSNLARPGGNITGLSLMAADLSAKRFELLQMLLPRLSNVAVLWDASNPGMALRVRETQRAAEQASIGVYDAGARNLDGLEASFAALSSRSPEALLVTAEPFTMLHRDRIVAFTLRNRIPTMFEEQWPVRGGGLISYGASIPKLFHRAASYVDKILKGAKPSGPDGAAWITDSGQNAIVRFDPKTEEIKVWKLPEDAGYANLNTAAFDKDGVHWFTGQNGIYTKTH